MSEPIKCFLLKYSGTRTRPESGPIAVYRDDAGREFHLGNIPSTDQHGVTVQPAPVGAMWDCDWFAGCHESSGLKYDRNPDGMVLCVRCPGGDWLIDGPSSRRGTELEPEVESAPDVEALEG